MVTGDKLAITREIGRLLGLVQRTLRAAQLSVSGNDELLTLESVLSSAFYQRL